MIRRLAILATLTVVAVAAVAFSGSASSASKATMAQAEAHGWDCSPRILILGYFHCTAPGRPSLLDVIEGRAEPPNLSLRVFSPEGLHVGLEHLRRADLYQGQPCPQEGLSVWPRSLPNYFGCHNFAP